MVSGKGTDWLGLLQKKGLWQTALLLLVAIVMGVTITPVVRAVGLAQEPTIPGLGMTLGDFIQWILASGIIGVAIAGACAWLKLPTKVVEILVPILSAAIGGAITAAIPLIAPDLLGKPLYEVILIIVSALIAWIGHYFGSLTIAAMLTTSEGAESASAKRVLKNAGIGMLLVAVTLGLLLAGFVAPSMLSAQTPAETVALMFANHPDFGCVQSFKIDKATSTVTKLSTPVMARIYEIDNWVAEQNAAGKKIDADWAVCYGWVWTFDRDVNATHYIQRGGIKEADRIALHYADINEILYDLGAQPAWRFILPNGRPESNHWQLYQAPPPNGTQFLMFPN